MSTFASSLNKRVKRQEVSILDFAAAPWGPKIELTPVQRFSVKLIYKLPLDDKEKTIRVWDKFKENLLYTFTETEYRKYLYEEAGRLNLPTDTAHMEGKYDTFIRCWGRRSGKCLDKSTLVYTKGGLFTIEDLWPTGVDRKIDDYTPFPIPIPVLTDQGWKVATEIYYGGVKKLLKVTLSNGLTIEPALDHKFRTLSASGQYVWKLAKDLYVGDTLCSLQEISTFDFKQISDEEVRLGLFWGLMYGDGSWSSDPRFCCHTSEHDLVTKFDSILTELFPNTHVKKKTYSTKTSVWDWLLPHKLFRELQSSWGVEGYSDGMKTLPPRIFKSHPEVRKAFLSGILATDGHVTKDLGHFELTLKPKGLIEDIQQLFLSLGVHSTIHKKVVKPKPGNQGGTYWRLTTVGTNTNLLRDIFKYCPLKRKTDELCVKESKHSYKSTFGAYDNLLPRFEKIFAQHSFGYHVDRSKSKKLTPHGFAAYYSYYQKYMETYKAVACMDPFEIEPFKKANNRRTTGLEIGRAISEAVEDFKLGVELPSEEFVRDLEDLKWIFDTIVPIQIVSIEESEGETYDIHVPDGNTFVANGLVTHNSEITALDMAFGIYLLLEKYDPHEYFHMPPNTEIFIPVLATSQDSSKRTFRKVRNMLASSGYFSSYCDKDDLQELFCKVYTPFQRENGAQFPSIIVQAFPLSESQVRGPASWRAVCDEIAYWPRRGNTSDEEVLKAIQPSLTTFKVNEDTPSEGKIFLISNAGVRSGQFFEMFDKAMRGESSNVIAFQASTQELNPTRISSDELRNHYNTYGDASYRTEHLSEFVDSISQWLSSAELNAMFSQERPSNIIQRVQPLASYIYFPKAIWPQYFYGFDLGLKNDAAALAICHWETNELTGERKLVFDYVERRKAREGKYAKLDELDGDTICDWIHEMSKIYPITDGVYDQWSGTLFGQLLKKRGVYSLRMEPATEALNSIIYLTFRSLSLNREVDIPTMNNKELELELQLLQCEMRPSNRIKVAAPAGKDYHDDMADAIARACWVASSYLDDKGPGGRPSQAATKVSSASGGSLVSKDFGAISRLKARSASDPRAAAKMMALRRSTRRY